MPTTSVREIQYLDIGSLAKETLTNTGLENLERRRLRLSRHSRSPA